MRDLELLAAMLAVTGGLGLPFAYLMPARYAWRAMTAPVLGIALLSVLLPIGYRAGATVPMLAWGALALGVAGLAAFGRRAIRDLRALPRGQAWLVGGSWLACTALLLAPRFSGSDQFAVFQGNPWDSFSYVLASVGYARRPYDLVLAATDAVLVRHPELAHAASQVDERPSIALLFAVATRVAPGALYRLNYAFVVFFMSQCFLVASFALRQLLPRAGRGWWVALAGVFPLGFWGQYVLDINAWSQVGSAPLLLLFVALVIDAAARGETAWRLGAVIALIVAGAVYLYPEGFIIYVVALGPASMAVAVWRMIRTRKLALGALMPLGGVLAGLAATVLYVPVFHFLVRQLTWSAGTRVDWWRYFQGFFAGRDGVWGSGFPLVSDFGAGLFGMYFATPLVHASAAVAVIRRVATDAVIIGAVLGLVPMIGARPSDGDRDERAARAAWLATAVLMLLPAAYLAHGANYWPAGKVVSYAAPVLMTVVALPAAIAARHRVLRPLRWAAIVFVAFQLACGVTRVLCAHRPEGIHYGAPYPVAVVSKRGFGWRFRGLERYVDEHTHVVLEPMDPWLRVGLIAFLFSRDVPYVLAGPVNLYFGAGRELPPVAPPWHPDIELSASGHVITVHYTDGRPDVHVKT